MSTGRRHFLQAAAGLAAGSLIPNILHAEETVPAKKLPIALQLYVMRGDFDRDVPGTLQAVAKAGFAAVEFWGYCGTPNVFRQYSATGLRKMLDDLGLKCCGMHHDIVAFSDKNLKTTIENNHILGNRFLVIAAVPELMGKQESILKYAKMLTETAKTLAPEKMLIGYHSHAFDFNKIDGRFAWDILFSHLDPEVIMQLDVGNCLAGNGDPLAMLKKFPGRTLSIHIKEHKDKTFDTPFYHEVFQLCQTSCKTEWLILEMGSNKGVGMEIPIKALAKLHRLGL